MAFRILVLLRLLHLLPDPCHHSHHPTSRPPSAGLAFSGLGLSQRQATSGPLGQGRSVTDLLGNLSDTTAGRCCHSAGCVHVQRGSSWHAQIPGRSTRYAAQPCQKARKGCSRRREYHRRGRHCEQTPSCLKCRVASAETRASRCLRLPTGACLLQSGRATSSSRWH